MKNRKKLVSLILSIISTVALGIVAIGSFFVFPHFSKLFEGIPVPIPLATAVILYSYKFWCVLPLATLVLGIDIFRRQELSEKYFTVAVILFIGGIILAFLWLIASVVAMYLPIFKMANLN
jgi:type II secretory pathway component PulF